MKNLGCMVAVGILAVILFLVVIVGVVGIGSYNNLVKLDQEVKASWAQVESQYQRRMDLLPNLVEIAKQYAGHEKKVFQDIADARSRYAGAPSGSSDKVRAAGEMEGAFARLLAIVESYPNLKANEQFTRLMDEWAGTENRIAVERQRFNETVKAYNMTAMSFTGRLWVSLFKFDSSKPYFMADRGAEKAPSAKDAFGQ